MLDLIHLPSGNGASDIQTFIGTSTAAGQNWTTWIKPRGKTMCSIFMVGKGGNGGTGVVAANSLAGGGGGGGSGAQISLTMPLALLPDQLFVSMAGISATTTLASYIAIAPPLGAGGGGPVANNVLIMVNGGGNGGNASAGTGGAAGAAGAVSASTGMPLGWMWVDLTVPGSAGGVGGAAVTAANVALPTNGLLVTAGTGGGGLPAAAATGTSGGNLTGAGVFPTISGGVGSATATAPADFGRSGCQPVPKLAYWMGGTGGASTHGTATGAGLVQSIGGNGAIGSGGGGNGGALTGSTAQTVVGMGGPAFAMIVCW
jgi:hypothetical protein